MAMIMGGPDSSPREHKRQYHLYTRCYYKGKRHTVADNILNEKIVYVFRHELACETIGTVRLFSIISLASKQ
jgi:hypothetical protein